MPRNTSSTDVRYATLRELVGVARYEWSARRAWKDWRAAVRGTWWWLVRRYPCELCEDCGRPVGRSIGDTYWRGPDDLWRSVVGSPAGTLCPADFTRRAEALGLRIHWEAVYGA